MSRILVIEDDFAVKLGLQYLLENCGYQVDLAENARLALEKLRQSSYDLAIVDLRLPDETGQIDEEAGIKILEQMEELYPALPAIVLTISTDQAAIIACQQLSNCKAYEQKDVDPPKFKDKVKRVLSGKPVEAH